MFGHREHLRLAWILIDRYGLDAAAPEIERRLRHLAEAHGMPEKYNRTMTLFWVRLVAHVAARTPAATSAEFLDAEDVAAQPGPGPAALLGRAALEPARPGGVGRPRPHRHARLSRIICPRACWKPTAW